MNIFRKHSHLTRNSLLVAAAILLLLSFFTQIFFRSKPSMAYQQKTLQHYIQRQLADAQNLLSDTSLMRRLILKTESLEEFTKVAAKEYGLFLFAETLSENPDPLFWNNQKIIPPPADFNHKDAVYFSQFINGYYVTQKTTVRLPGMTNNVIAYVLVPVLYKFYLETASSPTQFAYDKEAMNKIALSQLHTPYPIAAPDGTNLFYLTEASHTTTNEVDTVTQVLRLTAFVLLLVTLHLYAERIRKKWGAVKALIFLASVLLVSRLLLHFFPSLFSLRQFPLFDSTVYASSLLNRSLGDLLLSASFLCWIVLFAWNNLGPVKQLPSFLKGQRILVAGVAGIFVLIFTSFQLASVVHNLVANSKVSFEVTDFFRLDIYSVFGFITLALLSLSYYYFSRLLFRFVLLAFPNLVHLYFAVALVGLIFLTFQTGNIIILFYIPVLAWVVLYTLLLSQEQLIINRIRITITGILFWIFIFSISLALLIMQGNREKEQRERKGIADKYEQLTEPSNERTLTVGLTYLDSRYLKNNFQRFYREPESSLLRDSIANSNSITNYRNIYNVSIYVFDSLGTAINNPDNKGFAELNNIFTLHSKPIGKNGLYYYETSFDQFVYIFKRETDNADSTGPKGTLFILAMPKQFRNPNAFYPELFAHQNRNDIENSSVYAYAVYKNNKLTQYSSKYPFATLLKEEQLPKSEFENRTNGEYDELWYKASGKKIIVVARKKESLLESITLFSYLFCAFLLMVGIIQLFELFIRAARQWPRVELFSRMNIRTQIHSTIIFISVLSFLVIGAATISFFIDRYNRNNINQLSLTANGTVKELRKQIVADKINYDALNYPDTTTMELLKEVVSDIADAHGVIVNLYDLNGNLKVTSDEEIYHKGVLSTKMHPAAYYHLHLLNEVQRVQEEAINDFPYLSIYSALQNENGDTYAYLNIPSFDSQIELNQEISNFLVTIINLNAFIFLVAGVIALFITNRISRSFAVIGNKMKEITLGKTNEEIEWNRTDEIGELVTQYNKMVHELEQSAAALAKSEREGAWREMARQVAHEIKNPLTPMKLSIQYLQKAIQNNQPNVKDLTTNVASTLIEQIDHLSKIAADFSQFANISTKRMELIDLHTVIRSLLSLYATNPKVQLTWNPLPEELKMCVDKTHMNRLFTNLLTNAVDACSEKEKCIVSISEMRMENAVIVSVADNGDGIPLETQSKIFTPNFTTKTSGTGLGLAMCKGIVEGAGGAIWFETKEGEGTTFFVRLSLIG